MNILVPYSWLKEHLSTKATPDQMAEALSLCSQSVDKINRVGNDAVFEIEITTNRPDCLSIYGIARELAAVLPRFNHQAQLKAMPELTTKIPVVKKSLPLKVTLQAPSLCPRFTALIFDQVKYRPSPKVIQGRLRKAGIRALNNIVDISNYLMLELGQPMHTFDYDKIKQARMIMRAAKPGEKVVTLDDQTRILSPGTIIIEDGDGRIVDLCGIMGGQNSAVDQTTRRVLLFIQSYDPRQIRRSCQQMACRTDAAQRFEKGVEPEGVMPAMKKAVVMFRTLCGAKVASRLTDIYPHPVQAKTVVVSTAKINQLLGIPIKIGEAQKTLNHLGFATKVSRQQISATVPYWRHDDINLPEDLIEEIARVYGYHNLPSVLPSGPLPLTITDPSFTWENQIKQALKYWGWTETVNYSLVSQQLIKQAGWQPDQCLKISNPLSLDWVWLRPSLLPSLTAAANQNQPDQVIRFFEMAHVYHPSESAGKAKLPEENLRLAGLINRPRFYQVKGVAEAILTEMGIKAEFRPLPGAKQAGQILINNQLIGTLGKTQDRMAFFDLDFSQLVKLASRQKQYHPAAKTPPVIEDLTFIVPPQTPLGELTKVVKAVDPLIKEVSLVDTFQNNFTFRLYYQAPQKNLSRRDVAKIRNKIILQVEKIFQAKLRS